MTDDYRELPRRMCGIVNQVLNKFHMRFKQGHSVDITTAQKNNSHVSLTGPKLWQEESCFGKVNNW
jgi:hypothetical protein